MWPVVWPVVVAVGGSGLRGVACGSGTWGERKSGHTPMAEVAGMVC